MKSIKPLLLLCLLVECTFSLSSNAQNSSIVGSKKGNELETISLENAIDIALKNNLSVKQNHLQLEQSSNTYEQSKWSKYPSVNGGSNFNLFAGRNINPYTNGIITNTVGSNGFGISGSMMIFDGYQTKNNIAANQLSMEASKLDLQAIKNQITLNIVVAYLNLLSQEDLLAIAQGQLAVSQSQLERTQKLVNAGSLPETNLYDIKAQLANDELSVVNAENAIVSAKLTLSQLMNIGSNRNFDVVRVDVANPELHPYPYSANEVYEIAQSFMANVQAADMRVKVAQKSVLAAKGLKLPTITANASFNSSYSTAAENVNITQKIIEQEAGYVNVSGTKYPVIAYYPSTSTSFEKIPYLRQLGGNGNSSIGFNVRVPIFNGYNSKFRLNSAQIQQKQSELQAENIRVGLRQEIDQAFVNLSNSAKKYMAISNQVKALEVAFRASEAKFNVGSLNALDYNIAKSNLDRAKINQIQAKYDYLFRIKILDFYQNKPLSF